MYTVLRFLEPAVRKSRPVAASPGGLPSHPAGLRARRLAFWVGLGAAVVGAALALTGCAETSPVSQTSVTAADANAGAVRTVRLDGQLAERYGVRSEAAGTAGKAHVIRVPGTLEYNLERYAEVGPLVEGRVSQVHVRVGDTVKKGQRLATLLVPSIADAQASLVASRATSSVAERNAKREERLLAQDLTTQRDVEAARGTQIEATAAQAAAEARLRVLGAQVPAGHEIQAAGSVLLSSPIEGVVVRRDAVQGRYLRPAETAFVVADPTELWALVDVFENDLAMLRVGADADLHVDALGKSIKGKVVTIEPQLGQKSRAARARIVIHNADGALRAGLFVRAAISVPSEAGERLLVPSSAVQPLGNDEVVFVKRDATTYEIRNVKVRRLASQMAEIVEGLQRGESIVVENAFILRGEVTRQ